MARTIFISLPVTDLASSRRFYEALGFTNHPDFTDNTAAGMVWSDTITVMLLTYDKWREFTDRPICDPAASEVSLALSLDSRADVDRFAELAAANGGTLDVNPVQDHGFMYGRDVTDPDGHVWGAMWMDPAAASGNSATTAVA